MSSQKGSKGKFRHEKAKEGEGPREPQQAEHAIDVVLKSFIYYNWGCLEKDEEKVMMRKETALA